MYRALYRKWRPSRFEDVVGQQAIVTALKNQVATSRIGHAYLCTGTRGTGKTTCAKIFAKAVNCPHQEGGDPCCQCDICRGIENGSILDVVEIDAASNNGVDNIRDIRDETAYTPSECTYKVYIIDEVHMLSIAAFNALLKIMEEPPSHVIFILATTEIHKVPATILSRCQRYDFGRIQPQDIAARLLYIAGEEQIGLAPEAADLIARLADGALRDALSILDTCVGVSTQVDAELVRRMSGVTDRGYLFEISAGVHNRDSAGVLAQVATLRQRSVDMKRLCEELINHYRNLMLAALPGGGALLTGVPPEEESRYMQMAGEIPQAESIRAIQALGSAMERMSRGTDQRIELELALFSLTEPVAPAAQPAAATPFVSAPAAPTSSTWAPKAPEPAQPAAQQPPQQPEPAAAPAPVQEEDLPPWEVDEPLSPKTLPEKETPTPAPAAPVPQSAPSAAPADTLMLYPQWHDVVEVLLSSELSKQEPALIPYLRTSKAYFDGKRVLIDGGDVFRDFLRRSPESRVHIKDTIEEKTAVRCPIPPYPPPQADQPQAVANVEELLARMQAQGVDVIIEEKK